MTRRPAPPAVLRTGRFSRFAWWLMRRADQEYLLRVEAAVEERIAELQR